MTLHSLDPIGSMDAPPLASAQTGAWYFVTQDPQEAAAAQIAEDVVPPLPGSGVERA